MLKLPIIVEEKILRIEDSIAFSYSFNWREENLSKYIKYLKLPFIIVFSLMVVLSTSLITYANDIPYEYTFEIDAGNQFNGINGVKKIVMTFDDHILSAKDIKMGANVYVLPSDVDINDSNVDDLKVNILKPLLISGNKIEISFKNLEYLDYSIGSNKQYKVVIEKDANLHFDQLTDYILPFSIEEVLPGFESIFVNSSLETINNRIMKHNAPMDIEIHIPKVYLTEIITSHRYKGVADPELESHAITNIDVKADPEATRMIVSVNNEDQYYRELDYRREVGGFTMGQAGLEALICQGESGCTGSAKDIKLVAYNQYGKRLTERSFKLKVANNEKDFTTNDYIKKPDKVFGTKTTLLELIQNPKLLESILSQIPVTQLEKLGVTYSLGNRIEISNLEQFIMAINNPSFKTLIQTDDIIGDIAFERPLTLDSDERAIVGSVTMGSGGDIIARIKDSRITENLDIFVGEEGSAILENVHVDGFTTIDGANGSLHMFNFSSSNPIVLDHALASGEPFSDTKSKSIRIVNVGATPDFHIESDGTAELVGTYGEISIHTPNSRLILANSTEIEEIIVPSGNHVTIIKPRNKDLPSIEGSYDVIDTDPVVGEDGKVINEVYYPEILSESAKVWKELGQHFTVEKFPYGIEWEVVNPNVFGGKSKVYVENQRINIVDVTTEQMQEVVLQGILDGEIYRVTIFIEVTIE